jgi:hypothetical protein
MSDEANRDKPEEGSQSKEGEPSSLEAQEQEAEAKLERIIDRLPPEQIPPMLRELFVGIIERGSSQKLDPEALKIAAASVDKDNQNKFLFLTQKETNKAEQAKLDHDLKAKEHELKVRRYESQVKMLWPVLVSGIILVLGCITAGIYLAATGHETLGYSILSATISAVFAFFGGLGTAHFFKRD